jgi:ferrous iron transport protein A
MNTSRTTLLNQLPDGASAVVARVVSASPEVDAVALRRLGELGFIPGEPVRLLRRGPGGREPLAVLIGETMFALRLLEAQCIEVDVETKVAHVETRARPCVQTRFDARVAAKADAGVDAEADAKVDAKVPLAA